MKKYVWLLILALLTSTVFAAEDYIIPFYTWQTGDTITNPRLNGNETNITGGLSGGAKAINVGKVLMNGTAVINSTRAITATTGQFSSTLGVSGNATFGELTVTTINNTALTTTLNTLISSANTLTTIQTQHTSTINTLVTSANQLSVSVNSIQYDLNGFPDELKNLATAEIQQLENIGTEAISATEWGYVAALNQGLTTASNVTFGNITGTLATAAQPNITSLGTLTAPSAYSLRLTKNDGSATTGYLISTGGYSDNYNGLFLSSNGDATNQINTAVPSWRMALGCGASEWAGADVFAIGRVAAGGAFGSPSILMSLSSNGTQTLAGGLNVGSNATGAVANAVNINGAKLNSGYALNIKTDGTLDGGIQQHNGSATMFSVQGNGTGYFAGGLNVGTTGAGAGQINTSDHITNGGFLAMKESNAIRWTNDGLMGGTIRGQIYTDASNVTVITSAGGVNVNSGGIAGATTIHAGGIIDTDDTTDSTSGTTGSFHTPGGGGFAKHVVAGGGIDAGANGTYMKCKVIPIGDWNMDSTTQITVAHGLTLSKIRNVHANIRNDGNDLYMTINLTFNGAVQGSADTYDGTSVILNRLSGGAFDSDTFDSTSYNRGYITIWYEE